MLIAVVGGGSIGKRHIGNLLELGCEPGQIVAVDPRADRRDEIGARFGLPERVADISDIAPERVDVALITSPTALHIEHALYFARTGATLLVEKPLDAGLERIDELERAVEAGGNRLLVAYPFRFSDAALKLRELLSRRAIGRPLYFRGEFSEYLPEWHPWEDYRDFYMAKASLGGGSLLDQSHILDLAHWLLGPAESVFAFNGRVSDLEVETDDLAEMQVRFASGVIASIHQDMFGRRHRKRLEIMGSDGNLVWDALGFRVEAFERDAGMTMSFEFQPDHQIMYRRELAHLLAVHDGKETPRCSLADGVHGMRVIEAARRSAASARLEDVQKAEPPCASSD